MSAQDENDNGHDDQLKYADKIAKLLAKAESTNHPEEAETFFTKAQELMTKWAITEALLDEVRGVEREEIVQATITHGGYYAADKGALTYAVVRNNECRAVYQRSAEWTSPRTVGGKSYKMWYELTITGFKSDVNRVTMLDTSLQIQMAQALNRFAKDGGTPAWMSKTQNVRARQSFMEGFASGVSIKLREGTEAGRKAAEKDQAQRAGSTDAAAAESVALVLRSRKDRVDDWMDQHYGKLRAGRSSYRTSDSSAHNAGSAAGRTANVGQPGVGGSRKGLSK